jgi:hypothetical protein
MPVHAFDRTALGGFTLVAMYSWSVATTGS